MGGWHWGGPLRFPCKNKSIPGKQRLHKRKKKPKTSNFQLPKKMLPSYVFQILTCTRSKPCHIPANRLPFIALHTVAKNITVTENHDNPILEWLILMVCHRCKQTTPHNSYRRMKGFLLTCERGNSVFGCFDILHPPNSMKKR